MRENLRKINSLLTSLSRSGQFVFVCSLALGLSLGGSALVYLEVLYEKGEEAAGGGGPSESASEPRSSRTTMRPELAKSDSGKEDRGQADPRRTVAGGEGKVGEAGREQAGQGRERPDPREIESELRRITSSHPGEYGLVLWQPESGTRVAVGGGERFKSASLAKLPVLLALYREAAEGRLSLNERIEMSASDIQPGTGVLQYRQPGTTMTLRECARYLVKQSDNTAWSMLEDRLGEKRIESELASAGASSTRYEYARHTTTPADTLKLLQKISAPAYTTPEQSREMLAMMSGTAFEDRLPQGLPADARISHKIGTLGTNFGDAGIVFPPEDERSSGPFYVVVLSKNTSEAAARGAMQEISLSAYRELVDPEARPRSMAALPSREQKARRDQPA